VLKLFELHVSVQVTPAPRLPQPADVSRLEVRRIPSPVTEISHWLLLPEALSKGRQPVPLMTGFRHQLNRTIACTARAGALIHQLPVKELST